MQHFPSPDIGMFGRRQRHARGHRIPVTIKGFGAPRGRDTAVVVDTFGADDIAPLGKECHCCAVRVELQAALRCLLVERQRGKHFTRVVIETGEDLDPIQRTFATERALGADFYVEGDPGVRLDRTRIFTLTERAPLSWDAFSRFITTLQALRGADLLHVKGLVNVAGCRGPVAVQAMQHLALPPVELQAWPDDNRESRLAFVTRDVEEQAVRHLFSSVHKLSTSS
jgi:G3E family GTPase